MIPRINYRRSSRLGRALERAIDEILDQKGAEKVKGQGILPEFVHKGPDMGIPDPDSYFTSARTRKLQALLEQEYGSRSGQGLAVRIGRVTFKYMLYEFADKTGFSESSYRLMPLNEKLRKTGEVMAGFFNRYADVKIEQAQDKQSLYWHISPADHYQDMPAGVEPRYHLAAGLLQEALYWASGGKLFEVKEMQFASNGKDTCTILIQQMPAG